jgi:hypothetical protein
MLEPSLFFTVIAILIALVFIIITDDTNNYD